MLIILICPLSKHVWDPIPVLCQVPWKSSEQERAGHGDSQAYRLVGETEGSTATQGSVTRSGVGEPPATGSTNAGVKESLQARAAVCVLSQPAPVWPDMETIPAPILSCWKILGKWLQPSASSPSLLSRHDNYISLLILLRGLNKTESIKCFNMVPST